MQTKTIPASAVPSDPICCPKCKKQDLTMRGHVQRGFTERLVNGAVVEQKFSDDLERETAEIDCNLCQITWQIMTEDEHDLLVRNQQLEQTVIMTSGTHIAPMSKHIH